MNRTIAAVLLLALPLAAPAQKKEIQEVQRDVAQVQDQLRQLQQAQDQKMAALQAIVQTLLDQVNRTNTALAALEAGIRERMREQETKVVAPVSALGGKVDEMAGDFLGLKESNADISARIGKLDLKITDLANLVKVLQAPPAPPATPAGAPTTPASGPPANVSAESLYNDALRDKNANNGDLALQEFTDFLKYFPAAGFAANAQYHIGEIHYGRKDYEQALAAFDLVLKNYPDNSKSIDAQYMKARALSMLGRKSEAKQEFIDLIANAPRSDLATRARAELKSLGVSAPAGASRTRKK